MWTFNVHQSPAAIPMSSTATVYPPQPKNNYDYKEREHTHTDLQCRENLTKPCPILVCPRSDSLVCEVLHSHSHAYSSHFSLRHFNLDI